MGSKIQRRELIDRKFVLLLMAASAALCLSLLILNCLCSCSLVGVSDESTTRSDEVVKILNATKIVMNDIFNGFDSPKTRNANTSKANYKILRGYRNIPPQKYAD
ncbi:hypothetical protein PRIPAC_96753 [Pristionchus pacificus]|uniref:Uncharacterized protein n=1 Tax=Pristionchus pacificus TaxID=54126 RepID=A0A2A6BK88_PRIPA|nr:hypothetical protein PRIPAC_96753 [Pristionchus pacificus]|eukprot:PDM66236.1 hypothetical protein PRIPAC_45461 [Pristionchus pacificus]